MSDAVIQVNNLATNVFTGETATVSRGLFGGISITQTIGQSVGFASAVSDLGLSLIRWPGGTLAENSHVVGNTIILGDHPDYPPAYDLSYPEVLHPDVLVAMNDGNARMSLSQVLALAIAQDTAFSMILPSEGFADDRSRAYRETAAFLDRMFVTGDFNGGALPERIIFDIGNENYDVGSYGNTVPWMLLAIREFREAHPGVEFEVALQAMPDGDRTAEMIAIINDPLHGPAFADILAEVDIVRMHKLNQSLTNIAGIEDQSPSYWAISQLTDAVHEAQLSRDGSVSEVDLYFSAWTVNSNDVERSLVSGLPAATALLSMMTGMIELGTDYAAAWGITTMGAGTTTLTYISGGEVGETVLTPAAQLLSEMSGLIDGMALVQTDTLDAQRGLPFHQFAFAGDGQMVIYLAAGDLPEGGATYSVDLEGFGRIGKVEALSIGTEDGIAGTPVVGTPAVGWAGATISATFTQDYQIIQLVVTEAPVIEMIGTALADRLMAERGVTVLNGMGGNDNIYGGEDDEQIFGGSGSDWLVPGAGDDVVYGGTGSDFVVYGASEQGMDVDLARGSALGADGEIDLIHEVEHISGSRLDDTLSGDDGINVLRGQGGRDLIFASAGADTYDGGGSTDVLSYSRIGAAIAVDLTLGRGTGGAALGHTITGIEMVIGTAADDTITGSADRDFLSGRDGDDRFGATTGADVFYGGFGDDELDYSMASEGVRVFLNTGLGDGGMAAGHTYVSIENVIGTSFDDRISGTNSANEIRSGAGNDTLYTYGGDDVIFCGNGADYVQAGEGDDSITGGWGNDTIWAGAGIDSIYFSGRMETYDIQRLSARSIRVTDLTGSNGVDMVYDAERLVFGNAELRI